MSVIKSKMGTIKSKIGRKFEQKRKTKWVKEKANLVKAYCLLHRTKSTYVSNYSTDVLSYTSYQAQDRSEFPQITKFVFIRAEEFPQITKFGSILCLIGV